MGRALGPQHCRSFPWPLRRDTARAGHLAGSAHSERKRAWPRVPPYPSIGVPAEHPYDKNSERAMLVGGCVQKIW